MWYGSVAEDDVRRIQGGNAVADCREADIAVKTALAARRRSAPAAWMRSGAPVGGVALGASSCRGGWGAKHHPEAGDALSDAIATGATFILPVDWGHRKDGMPFCSRNHWGQSWRRGRTSIASRARSHRLARHAEARSKEKTSHAQEQQVKERQAEAEREGYCGVHAPGNQGRDHLRREQQPPGAPGQRTRHVPAKREPCGRKRPG